MKKMMTSERIKRTFSRSAVTYSQRSGLQKTVGQDLMDLGCEIKLPRKISDIGCGTGRFTKEIRERFPKAQMLGIDFATGMVLKAQHDYEDIYFIQADATHLPLKNNSMDIVYSNLMYQWVMPLEESFLEVYRILKRPGQFIFSTMGQKTFKELFVSLEKTSDDLASNKNFWRRPFLEADDLLRHLMYCGFKGIEISFKEYRPGFKDIFEFLWWLKAIGVNTRSHHFFLGKKHLSRANRHVLENFMQDGKFIVTFDVLFVKAWK